MTQDRTRWLVTATVSLVLASGGCDLVDEALRGHGVGGSGGSGGSPADAGPGPTEPGACVKDTDCRLFSDYCTGCDCRALSRAERDPTCSGPGVRCLVDPCQRKTAACVKGRCVASPQAAYDPCAGKKCGDPCTLCPPDAANCAETTVLKSCSPSGQCLTGQVKCN
jgi:hypothetical protein